MKKFMKIKINISIEYDTYGGKKGKPDVGGKFLGFYSPGGGLQETVLLK